MCLSRGIPQRIYLTAPFYQVSAAHKTLPLTEPKFLHCAILMTIRQVHHRNNVAQLRFKYGFFQSKATWGYFA